MVSKLLQHVLIWLAASASIVAGVSWAYTFGFAGYRAHLRPLGLLAATLALVFGAALVQRSPVAVVALVMFSALSFVFGIWLLAVGARGAGLSYMLVGATYVVGLGPTCLRWLTSDRS